jgi:hypothetical protein
VAVSAPYSHFGDDFEEAMANMLGLNPTPPPTPGVTTTAAPSPTSWAPSPAPTPRPTPMPTNDEDRGKVGWNFTDTEKAIILDLVLPAVNSNFSGQQDIYPGCLPWIWEPEDDTFFYQNENRGGGRPVDELIRHLLYDHAMAVFAAVHYTNASEFSGYRMDEDPSNIYQDQMDVVVELEKLESTRLLKEALGQLSLSALRNLHSYDHAGRWGSVWHSSSNESWTDATRKVYDFQALHCDLVVQFVQGYTSLDWEVPIYETIPGLGNRSWFEDTFLRPTTAEGTMRIDLASADKFCDAQFYLGYDDVDRTAEDVNVARRRSPANPSISDVGIMRVFRDPHEKMLLRAVRTEPVCCVPVLDKDYCVDPTVDGFSVETFPENGTVKDVDVVMVNRTLRTYVKNWIHDKTLLYRQFQGAHYVERSTEELIAFARYTEKVRELDIEDGKIYKDIITPWDKMYLTSRPPPTPAPTPVPTPPTPAPTPPPTNATELDAYTTTSPEPDALENITYVYFNYQNQFEKRWGGPNGLTMSVEDIDRHINEQIMFMNWTDFQALSGYNDSYLGELYSWLNANASTWVWTNYEHLLPNWTQGILQEVIEEFENQTDAPYHIYHNATVANDTSEWDDDVGGLALGVDLDDLVDEESSLVGDMLADFGF